MTRQITASLESGDVLLSIAVPVIEETGSHLPAGANGSRMVSPPSRPMASLFLRMIC